MTSDRFTFVTTLAIPIALFIASLLWTGIRRGTRRLNLPRERRRQLQTWTSLVLGGWLVLTSSLGAAGAYAGGPESAIPGLLLALALVLPIVVGLTIVTMSKTARDILAVTPAHLLIGIQTYRVFGVLFLVLMAQGRLPGAFANPAGWGDLLVGISAPIVAVLYLRDASKWHGLAVAWNIFGLADFAVALTTGLLTSPGALQRLAFDAPNTLIGTFPLVLVPTVAVPLSILFHLLSLRSLRRGSARQQLAAAA